MKILGVIPARYASSRFPGKPLTPIGGKPLLRHVIDRCRSVAALSETIVATDDTRIRDAIESHCHVEMTRADHPSGTDRIAEVARRCSCDGIVNIQGNEPLIEPIVIQRVAEALNDSAMTTAASRLLRPEDYRSPNVVKVVVNQQGRALYFSRRTIPYLRDTADQPDEEQLAAFPFLKHLGIYGYRRETLLWLVEQPVSALEQAERLEQLRALDHGVPIAVLPVDYAGMGVDVPEDVPRVEAMLKE